MLSDDKPSSPRHPPWSRQKSREQGGGFVWPFLWTFLVISLVRFTILGQTGTEGGGATTSGEDSGKVCTSP